ncbi:FAD-dependent oxidoreductase [Candidatus Villigracilis saccharophilus]|uniref:oxidoreductase n=1 Tax=Candidatus Villigracilis saccharophilus TaxID=3140684 RepID=UPI003134799A|nr:FAD-dependent oxidoreductase [Anaerolineales bacterium]
MPSRYDILFQPIKIGPVTAPNRFYQVPHCNGFGWRMPKGLAAMRGMKAEGGWGVVCTEETEIHHTSDLSPFFEGHIWSDDDIPSLLLMTDAVHKHGALAGIELSYNGRDASNLYSRAVTFDLFSRGLVGGSGYEPGQSRAATKDDLKQIRKWHRNAAIRAKNAGFDIIYCYAAHNLTLAFHLMSKDNDRADEYGGSLENRTRFFRELIEDTKEAVGDTCAVAVRFAVDELIGASGMQFDGEARDIVSMLAELPDLWDVNVSSWKNDSTTSRFEKEGNQEKYISFVKKLTTKPVVGVGRYTSPDSMVSAIERGIMDMIGAARPSIADPFLPNKIKAGRHEDIRECIGCNICVTGDTRFVPIRCTQNPTMGEEWRRNWHPEIIAPKKSEDEILIVGAGPAGLEAARALGQRGYHVVLTDAKREAGGRVALESALPNLNEWRRVIDWRLTQIQKIENIYFYPSSPMTAKDILEAGAPHVILATGAKWRRDGIGRYLSRPVKGGAKIFTPDDFLESGGLPPAFQQQAAELQKILIYDDDHYYMGGVLAELLAENGCEVTLMTPAPSISYWTQFTLEQDRILKQLHKLNVTLLADHIIASHTPTNATVTNVITSAESTLACDAIVMVTDRIPNDALYHELKPALAEGKLKSLRIIGDAEAPNIIAQAIFSGHLAAREFDELIDPDVTPFKVER